MFFAVLLTTFVAEALVMVVLTSLPPFASTWVEAICDASILSLLAASVLWWAVFRPLHRFAVTELAKNAAILRTAADGIITTDEHGIIEGFNPSASRIFGYAPAEALGHNVALLMPEPQDSQHDDSDNRYRKIGFSQIIGSKRELIGKRKDGTTFPMELAVSEMRFDNRRVFSGIIRDISKRKAAEQALHRSSDMLRALVEASPAGITVVDLEGRVQLWNSAAERMFGWTSAEVLGQFLPAVPEEKLEEFRAVRELVRRGETLNGVDVRRQRKGGVPIDISLSAAPLRDASGQVTGVVGIMIDLTRRNHAREQSQIQAHALSAAANGIAITQLDGTVLWVNPAFCQLTGYAAEELIGQNPRLLKSGRQPPEFYATMWQTIKAGNIWRGEVVNRRKDGTLYTEDMTITPVQNGGGQITHFIAIKQDITARKQAEEKLQESNRRLENALTELKTAEQQVIQQERLRALGTMASGIAHDFNNALMPVLGFSELLLQRPDCLDDRVKVQRYLQLINTSASDAGTIVNRLRQFYRHREDDDVFAPVGLNDLINEAIALTKPKWQAEAQARGVTITVQTELSELPPITASAPDLREALTNLLFNAVDAMPTGGRITLRTRRANGHVRVEITDTGTGMTEEIRRRCLEPFFSTKGERGTGLGLSMVYGIVQRHAGNIDIKSEPGRGTTFSLQLPIADTVKRRPLIAPAAGAPRPMRVLFADDDSQVRDVITEYLLGDGHTVTAVASGPEAMEKFHTGTFDVVLVDRAMPGMSGDQLAALIKSVAPKQPVIMLTGFGTMMQAADEIPTGVDSVISKPISIQRLREALSRFS